LKKEEIMSNAQAQVVDAPAEPKTAADWAKKVEEYDITLAGPSLEPAIKTAIEKLREHAVQQKFLAEVTAPTVNVDAPAQQFVTPKVPDTMPVATAERLREVDADIAQVETFLKNAPLPHLRPGAESLLAEKRARRAKILFDFQNPKPLPVPALPPPIQLPVEVVELVREIIRAEVPSIIAQTIAWFQANPEWLRS
jgi:hypothetical protein